MTLQQFEQLTDEGVQHELDEGRLLTTLPPKLGHSIAAANVRIALAKFVEPRKLGKVLVEAGFLLSENPPTVRQPDIAFVRMERIPNTLIDEYLQGAPDLAIEIVSPPDSIAELDRKVEQYLNAGSTLVWILMPKHERIRIFRADGTSTVRHRGELLDAPELFLGWSVEVE